MMKTENIREKKALSVEEGLQSLVNDYITQKQTSLIQMKKGILGKKEFLEEAAQHVKHRYFLDGEQREQIVKAFEQYIFGYSRLSPLIDDPQISDIRVIGYDCIRIKRAGRRMDAGISFSDEKEYRQFIDYIATKNQVNTSHLNAIQRFTDIESHSDFILRFTLSMPLVNTYHQPYLCIRKVPKSFPQIGELVEKGMCDKETAELLVKRFRQGSTLICGGNSSGKTTLLNALKETLPDDMAILVAQQADELTTRFHPDMMFLHSLPNVAESQVNYDLKHISIAGLTMDVDFFIVGEVKGEEALYLLNAAYTGQICAATIHAPSADRAPNKLVDYAMYGSRYSRDELMKMMDCFKTLVFMEHYRVKEIFECKGWDEKRRELAYERIY
ncbi:MAG: Flp pilus assembly complex ATPase component TadA [Bacteroidales bacterium]|nr:Flp pilus assembly complex ATPase component TadA [Lachnoclostridium sp.]MCM1383757.1 Flp pilus assembly complex ATPase component TadA [Lachnoclostridium sp.]MCM1464385.1 Flp pilus assembly complex ATPase component TadA [Bacteroidales bacterium]